MFTRIRNVIRILRNRPPFEIRDQWGRDLKITGLKPTADTLIVEVKVQVEAPKLRSWTNLS